MKITKRIAAPHSFLELYDDAILLATLDYLSIHPEIQIIDIEVKHDHRNKGYGKRLLQELISIAKNGSYTKIFLEVRASNSVARHMYDTFGFTETSVRKDYYSSPTEDAILMERSLS
jgi:ribosomal-protein-alanine N-acetyltransferase